MWCCHSTSRSSHAHTQTSHTASLQLRQWKKFHTRHLRSVIISVNTVQWVTLLYSCSLYMTKTGRGRSSSCRLVLIYSCPDSDDIEFSTVSTNDKIHIPPKSLDLDFDLILCESILPKRHLGSEVLLFVSYFSKAACSYF